MVEPGGPQVTVWRMRIVSYKHTQRICSTNCFFTATVVRTRLGVTCYVIRTVPVLTLYIPCVFFINYVFNTPTECTYTIKLSIITFSPKRFDAYCAIFRENYFACSKLLSHFVITFVCSSHQLLKNHVCFIVELQMLKPLCKTL